MKQTIQVVDGGSYKIGLDEIVGLKPVLMDLMRPIQQLLKEHVYWNDLELEETEYKRRDGFIPYSHNNGGLQLSVVIPKCESNSFSYLEFGECDDAECDHENECGYESEGHLDARLRVWLKFEGLNQETGELSFYLYCGGGNGDAPYFRTNYESDIFEASFAAKSLAGVRRSAAKHIKALTKILKGA